MVKFILNTLIIAVLAVFNYLSPAPARAQDLFRVLTLRISPQEKSATIYWSTNYPAKGRFDFGRTNGFGSWMEDNQQTVYHESELSGLMPEQKYYFRLTATAIDGQAVTSDIYEFTTSYEKDVTPPILKNIRLYFITGNTASFAWETEEAADTCVKFSTDITKINNERCNGDQVKIHDFTVKGLTKNTLYYYQVSSKDKKGNRQDSIIKNFRTVVEEDKTAPELAIYDISPFNRKAANNLYEAVITIKTNRAVSGTIKYGEKSKNYNKEVKLSAPRSTESKVILPDLKIDQTYYYKVYLTDVIDKKLETQEYSFKTLPESVLTEILTPENDFTPGSITQDFDQDGLTNAAEITAGTDPVKADTDGDGYLDGREIRNGYNPLGEGRLNTPNSQGYAYGQTRLTSLRAEQNLANDLKARLETEFNGSIPKSNQHWYTLTKAYIYGGYPVAAIAQAIKHGGKTVHPSIPFSAWKKTADYLNYINCKL